MRGDGLTRRNGRRAPVLAGVLAVALLLGSVAGFFGVRRSLRDDDERTFAARAESLGRRVELLTDDLVAAADRAGDAVTFARSTGDFVPTRDLRTVTGPLLAVVGARAVRLEAAYPTDDVSDPVSLALAVARARDEPRMSAPPRPGADPVLVIPGYRDGRAPASIDARESDGGPDLLVDVDVDAIVARAVTGAPTMHVAADDGGVPLATSERQPRATPPAVTSDIEVAGRVWTFAVRTSEPFAHDAVLPWVVLLGGLLLSGLAAAAALFVRRSTRDMQRRAGARERELAVIAEAGPLLQQSLELAEVLPDFVVRLSDDFELERVALLLRSAGETTLREVFAVGSAGGRRPLTELRVNPPSAQPAEEFLLRLHRSGRDVGALRIRPRAAVDAPRMRALIALADLLAAALGNIQLYADEQETVRRLQEVDRLKNDFVSTVSHELRTTTTAIAGFGELLENQWDTLPDSTRRDFLGRVTRNASTLRLLVDDMLDFSRLDRMSLAVSPETIDLSVTVGAVADQVSSLLDRHEVCREIEPGVAAWTDPRAVERIVSNLLSNAAKFSPPDTRVTVAVRRLDHHAEVSVSDEGPGVSPDDRRRIFARFYRGESAAARSTRGAGVGLAIVLDLVERLGGTIHVSDAPGGGARFVVTFPLESPADESHRTVELPQEQRDPIP